MNNIFHHGSRSGTAPTSAARRWWFRGFLLVALLLAGMPCAVQAYPEFREFIVKKSGNPVNCAFCHQHSDGPEGAAPGQIGGLKPEALQRLARARAAFDPGQDVDSPILNAFGNSLSKRVGKKRFLELRLHPVELAALLDPKSDLDQDGITDAREYLEGTHPVNPGDGCPWRLFAHSFRGNLAPIGLTLAATLAGLYGLTHLLRAFDRATRPERPAAPTDQANSS